jgi:hypothetical protein
VFLGFFKLNAWSPSFAGMVNSTGKFNSIVVEICTVIGFLLLSQGCPLILKNEQGRQDS